MPKFKIGDRVKYAPMDDQPDTGTIIRFCNEYCAYATGDEAWWVLWDSDGGYRWIDASDNSYSLIDLEVCVKKHPYAEVIKQWADNQALVVEFRCTDTAAWTKVDNPSWNPGYQYRIKPEPPKEIKRYFHADNFEIHGDYAEGALWEDTTVISGDYIEITYNTEGKVTNIVFVKNEN